MFVNPGSCASTSPSRYKSLKPISGTNLTTGGEGLSSSAGRMSHGQRSLPRGHSWTGDQKGLPRGPYDPKRNGGGRSVFTRQMSITGGSKQGSKVKSLVLPPREFPPGPFESPGYGYLTDNARLAWCEHRLGYFEGWCLNTHSHPPAPPSTSSPLPPSPLFRLCGFLNLHPLRPS